MAVGWFLDDAMNWFHLVVLDGTHNSTNDDAHNDGFPSAFDELLSTLSKLNDPTMPQRKRSYAAR
jgi:hypothetical protein